MQALRLLAFAALAAPNARPSAPVCAPATSFTGTICVPSGGARHPAILLLGGSEGGDGLARIAPALATQGYVAASVAYFGAPGLPPSLEGIRVETIGNALSALMKRGDVDTSRIAILGISKGGELALLAASLYPQIRAAVGVVPSPFAWQGVAMGPTNGPTPSWTYGGHPVPFVQYGFAMSSGLGAAYASGQPLDLRPGYEGSMKEHSADVPGAMFHLEAIKGPVLLLAAGDDHVWNSVEQSTLAIAYLREHHHAYADSMVAYPTAGHMFLLSDSTHSYVIANRGPMKMLLGGTEAANIQAGREAWVRIDEFLRLALR